MSKRVSTIVIGPGKLNLIGNLVRLLKKIAYFKKTDFFLLILDITVGTLALYLSLILTIFLFLKSTPDKFSINVVTKCWRLCSPSVIIDKPAAIWSSTDKSVAFNLPNSNASPDNFQGLQSLPVSAIQLGFGRLPVTVEFILYFINFFKIWF